MHATLRTTVILAGSISLLQWSTSTAALGQAFVEYPGQPQTYGDHTLNSSWDGGPTGITVTFDSDDVTLHEDGVGSSQRTSRNTQNFVSPSTPDNPQSYDNPAVVDRYGSRLPLIQQMSANGTSVLTYAFDAPVNTALDLFITDVDFSDAVTVTAFDDQDAVVDLTRWTLVDEGDLSLFRDTGGSLNTTPAPTPVTLFEAEAISLTAADNVNYNRSYSILRSPDDQNLSRIEITFTGTNNSPSRALPNTGSHIYTALATATTVPEPGTGLAVGSCFALVCLKRRRRSARPTG